MRKRAGDQAAGELTPRPSVRPIPGPWCRSSRFQRAGRDQFVVLQVTGRRPEGEVKYEDVRDRIRDQLGQQLAIRRYLDRLRKATYVEIRS